MEGRFESGRWRWIPVVALLAPAGVVGCAPPVEDGMEEDVVADTTTLYSFEGADYATQAEMVAHGERIAQVLGCNSCHLADYSGADFGELIPLVEGLWATNISLSLPALSDAELENLLRDGVHPSREIYLMPSKQSQHLSDRDMGALIAFLRTIPPTGAPSPVPPEGFEEAVTARLPEDYWRTALDGQPRSYHNAAEEVAYFRENAPPEFGPEYTKGRLVALTVCTACHGAAVDGVGEPAGDIQAVLDYDDDEFARLLREGIDRNGQSIEMNWGGDHVPDVLTDGELDAVMRYARLLAESRAETIAGGRGGKPRDPIHP